MGGNVLLEREENLKLISLEIKRLRQLKVIKSIENTMNELYDIKKELKNKLDRIESLEEIALNEIVDQLNILDEIDTDIKSLKGYRLESPIETLAFIKSSFPLPSVKTVNRLEGL